MTPAVDRPKATQNQPALSDIVPSHHTFHFITIALNENSSDQCKLKLGNLRIVCEKYKLQAVTEAADRQSSFECHSCSFQDSAVAVVYIALGHRVKILQNSS